MTSMAASSPQVQSGRTRAFVRAAAVIVVVIGLDQLTKALVRSGIAEGSERSVFFFVKLVHVRNKGVAFGFFSGGGVVVLVFTLIALGLLVGYLAIRPNRPWLWLPTGLLIAGAGVDRRRPGQRRWGGPPEALHGGRRRTRRRRRFRGEGRRRREPIRADGALHRRVRG